VVLTFIDLVGFIPTFKKSYSRPFDEQLGFFVIMTVRNFISIAALQNYSMTTVLFPAAVGVAALVFVLMVIIQRRRLRPH
jgi:low affinity Fe/Cu permease